MATPPTVKVSTHANGGLMLEGALCFTTVSAALAEIKPHLARGVRTLDLSGVTHADSAGLALLVECVKEAQTLHGGLSFKGVPDQLSALAAACELSGLLAAGDRG